MTGLPGMRASSEKSERVRYIVCLPGKSVGAESVCGSFIGGPGAALQDDRAGQACEEEAAMAPEVTRAGVRLGNERSNSGSTMPSAFPTQMRTARVGRL